MVRQIADRSEYVLDAHVDRLFGEFRTLDQVEQVEAHPFSLEAQPIVHRNDPVAVLVQELEPGEYPGVVPLPDDETAAEDEQDRRPVQRVAGDDRRLIDIHI